MASKPAKPPTGNSSKAKDKKKQEKAKVGVNDKLLVLTPSETALGIRITQPKQKTIDTMTRLYAVPSEKLRVWTSWLTKVGERADDWQWWLRAQIGLTLRISDQLQLAVSALEAEEKSKKFGEGDGKTTEVATMSEETEETEKNATVPEVSDADFTDAKAASSPGQDLEVPATKYDVPEESGNTLVPEGEPGDRKQPEEEVSDAKRSEGVGDKNKGNKEKKRKAGKLEPKIVYKEGFWPIGVRWKPLSQRDKRKPPPKRETDNLPIPGTEEAMAEFIRQIKHQGVIYRSLYKHWSQTADQAVKEIVGRTVLPTKQVYLNGEEVPYFFYLEMEPDIDYVIEHDDEKVLLPDPGREKITHEFTHLYFNLSDKPGKGGKPWI